ncbi:hypothetical protein [Gaoshiqia sp. Z1-71]|uniref:hypothetical protein n=1 Tax=Gaoshiqia hydrogeniformans TaxID=3290090 RepID=UPI003BF90FD1
MKNQQGISYRRDLFTEQELNAMRQCAGRKDVIGAQHYWRVKSRWCERAGK